MKKTIKKIYENKADVRDYDVRKCIKTNKNMEIKFKEDIMTLTPLELKIKLKKVSKKFISKIGGKDYKLYSYDWNPDIK